MRSRVSVLDNILMYKTTELFKYDLIHACQHVLSFVWRLVCATPDALFTPYIHEMTMILLYITLSFSGNYCVNIFL